MSTKTRKQLKEIYSQACKKRQELFRKLSKDEGKIGFALWNDPRMVEINDECNRIGDEWRDTE